MMTNRLMKTFGLMLIAGTSVNCMSSAETGPATCKDAKTAYGVSSDGPQTLYLGGDKTMPWSAFCVGMASDDPKEFIELPQFTAAGKQANYSQFTEAPVSAKQPALVASDDSRTFHVMTQYEKVRIDPVDLTIDISNKSFVHGLISPAGMDPVSVALGNVAIGYMPYGVAMECGDQTVEDSAGIPSRVTTDANIDLTGLPFELAETQLCSGTGGSTAVADSTAPTKIVNFHAQGTNTAEGTMTCGRASVRCLPEPAINGQVGGETTIQLRYVGPTGGFGF